MTCEQKKSLVEDIISAVVCSNIWDAEQRNNPELAASMKRLQGVFANVGQYIPKTLGDELEDAVYEYAATYERAAILHGIHVADALRDVTAHLSDYADLI